MKEIDGQWIIYGVEEDDPYCIHTVDELIDYIDEVGFLPLFQCEIPGFSVEERTVGDYWWTGDDRDPWMWRELIARTGKVAYGKFFNKKNGFISKKWFPYYANFRRDGYDFDSLWEDGKANQRQKKLMDPFLKDEDLEIPSYELKTKTGFCKGGEKNFEGMVTSLQTYGYLCVRDFRQKTNKKGEPYGWPIAIYCTPEHLWGYKHITSAYKESAEESKKRIFEHIKDIYPVATDKDIKKMFG